MACQNGTSRMRVMNRTLILALVSILSAACGEAEPERTVPEVPFSSPAEIGDLVRSASLPVLVEFSVPVGCLRCDQMRPQIDALAEKLAENIVVRRINLNSDMAAAMRIRVCPTYVVFLDGSESVRSTYPTSADLLEAQILGLQE